MMQFYTLLALLALALTLPISTPFPPSTSSSSATSLLPSSLVPFPSPSFVFFASGAPTPTVGIDLTSVAAYFPVYANGPPFPIPTYPTQPIPLPISDPIDPPKDQQKAQGLVVWLNTSSQGEQRHPWNGFFPPGTAAGTMKDIWYTPPPFSTSETAAFLFSGDAAATFVAPAASTFPISPYPSNQWGLPPQACTSCGSHWFWGPYGECDSGLYGNGECHCFEGRTGSDCSACLPGFLAAGGRCKDCRMCVYGTCSSDSWNNACQCQNYWQGTYCDQLKSSASSQLLPLHTNATTIENQRVLVSLKSTQTYAFDVYITAFPAVGQLWTTHDQLTLGELLTSSSTPVPRSLTPTVFYVPPAGEGADPGEVFTTFEYRVYSPSAPNNYWNRATASIYVARINRPPIINLATTIVPPGSTTGSILATQGQTLIFYDAAGNASPFTLSDPDANTDDELILTLSLSPASTGVLGFNFRGMFNPAYLSSIIYPPTPVNATLSLLDGILLRNKTIQIRAPINVLNQFVSNLLYDPADDFDGPDELSITINDQGHSGLNALTEEFDPSGLTDTSSIDIFVQHANQRILFHFGDEQQTNATLFLDTLANSTANEPLSLSCSLRDADAGTFADVQLRMSVMHGSISFADTDGITGSPVTYITGSGSNDADIIVNGTMDSLSALLHSFTYTPLLHYYGAEVLDMFVTDGGASGVGSATSHHLRFDFEVKEIVIPPLAQSITVPIEEESWATFTLSATSLLLNNESFTYTFQSLPDPSCAEIWTWDTTTSKRVSMLQASMSPMNVSAPYTFYARLKYESRYLVQDSGGCPFRYYVTSNVTHGQSNLARIRFVLTRLRNHAPTVTSFDQYILPGIDRVITLRGADFDRDSMSYFITGLPNPSEADVGNYTLWQFKQTSGAPAYTYERGSAIDGVGITIQDGAARLIVHMMDPNTSFTFRVGAVDSNRAFSYEEAFITIYALNSTDITLTCPNQVVTMNADNEMLPINLQATTLLAYGIGYDTIAIETLPQPDKGALYLPANPGGELGLGTQLSTTPYIARLDPFQPPYASSQLYAFEFVYDKPVLYESGVPFTSFSYSCKDLEGRQSNSSTMGVVSINVQPVNRAPSAIREMTLVNVDYSEGLRNYSFNANMSDPDIIAYYQQLATINANNLTLGGNLTWCTHLNMSIGINSTIIADNSTTTGNSTGMDNSTWMTGNSTAENTTCVDEPIAPPPLRVRIVQFPRYGILVNYDGTNVTNDSLTSMFLTDVPLNRFSYIPLPQYSPPFYDTFMWQAFDGSLGSKPSVTNIVVGAESLPPTIIPADPNQNLTTNEGTWSDRLAISFNLTEPTGLSGEFRTFVVSLPDGGGTLRLQTSDGEAQPVANAPGYTLQQSTDRQLHLWYTPPMNRPDDGNDTFILATIDSLGTRSEDIVVTVTITSRPPPPVAIPVVASGVRDHPILILLNATTSGDPANRYATLTSLPSSTSQGRLYVCPPSSGPWLDDSNQAASTLTPITSTNQHLLAGCNGSTTDIGVVFVPIEHYYNRGGPVVQPAWEDQTPASALTSPSPTIVLGYQCHDAAMVPSDASLTINVDYFLYPPKAISGSVVSALRNDAVLIQLHGVDLEGSFLSAIIRTLPAHGKLYQLNETAAAIADSQGQAVDPHTAQGDLVENVDDVVDDDSNRLIYVPATNYYGNDSFTFDVVQIRLVGNKFSDSPALVLIDVGYAPIAPAFVETSTTAFTMPQDSILLIKLPRLHAISNTDGRSLTYSIVGWPSRGGLYQVLPSYTNTTQQTYEAISLGVRGSAITSWGSGQVTHPNGFVAFQPTTGETGDANNDDYYASFKYTVRTDEGLAAPAPYPQIDMNVFVVHTKPTVSNTSFTCEQNSIVVVSLFGSVDPDATGSDAYVESQPWHGGMLCQFERREGFETPCGDMFGPEIIGTDVKVLDSQKRIVYKPPHNEYGQPFDSFYYTIEDSFGQRPDQPGLITIDVEHVNQPPFIPPNAELKFFLQPDPAVVTTATSEPAAPYTGPNPELIDYWVDYAAPPIKVTLPASDPDHTTEQLTFTLLNLPKRGYFTQLSYVNDTSMGTPLWPGAPYNNTNVTLPLNLTSPYLLFHPSNDGGGPNPFDDIVYNVTDPKGLQNGSVITMWLDCGLAFAPNIWTVGAAAGPLCLPCPRGAYCSNQGTFKPMSQPGWWRSPVLDSHGGPIYLECQIPSSCLSAPYEQFNANDPSFNQSSLQFSGYGCAVGYGGRMCAACMEGFYPDATLGCVQCPDGVDSAATLRMLLPTLAWLIPLLILGLAALWVMKYRLDMDLDWMNVCIGFFQAIDSFKTFNLNWPPDNAELFDSFSFISVNFDLLAVECSVPSLQFTTKWLAFMLIPIAAMAILAVITFVVVPFVAGWDWMRRRALDKLHNIYRRENRYRRDNDGADGEDEEDVDDDDADGDGKLPMYVDDGDDMSEFGPLEAKKGKMKRVVKGMFMPMDDRPIHSIEPAVETDPSANRPLPYTTLLGRWLHTLTNESIGLATLFCDFIYLPLCIMCMNILSCTRLPDGTYQLDYEPSLRCDEPWWDYWSKISILFLLFYSLGIPLVYMWIFYRLRPQVHTYPLPMPRSLRFLAGLCYCPRSCNKKAWKEHILIDKRERVRLDSEQELERYEQLQEWSETYEPLIGPYHENRYYWNMAICARSFLIALFTVFLQHSPVLQTMLVLLVLVVALLFQVYWDPYAPHPKYNVNIMEVANLVGMIIVLMCGMMFYITARDHDQDRLGFIGIKDPEDVEIIYPEFRSLLSVIIWILMFALMFMGVHTFFNQIIFALRYQPCWQRSRPWRKRMVRRWKARALAIMRGNKVEPNLSHDQKVPSKDSPPSTFTMLQKKYAVQDRGGDDGDPGHSDSSDAVGACRPAPAPSPRDGQSSSGSESAGFRRLRVDIAPNGQTIEVERHPTPTTVKPNLSAQASYACTEQLNSPDADHEHSPNTPQKSHLDTSSTPSGSQSLADDYDVKPPPEWRAPKLSILSPLRELEAKALYTHARYVRIDQLTLEQLKEVNAEGWAAKEEAEQAALQQAFDDGYMYLASEGLVSPVSAPPSLNTMSSPDHKSMRFLTPSPNPLSPYHKALMQANNGHTSEPLPSPPSIVPFSDSTLDPSLTLLGVDIGHAVYGKPFKPPPPILLWRQSSPEPSSKKSDGSDDEDFESYHARLKRGRHLRKLTQLTGIKRFRDVVQRMLAFRRDALIQGQHKYEDLEECIKAMAIEAAMQPALGSVMLSVREWDRRASVSRINDAALPPSLVKLREKAMQRARQARLGLPPLADESARARLRASFSGMLPGLMPNPNGTGRTGQKGVTFDKATFNRTTTKTGAGAFDVELGDLTLDPRYRNLSRTALAALAAARRTNMLWQQRRQSIAGAKLQELQQQQQQQKQRAQQQQQQSLLQYAQTYTASPTNASQPPTPTSPLRASGLARTGSTIMRTPPLTAQRGPPSPNGNGNGSSTQRRSIGSAANPNSARPPIPSTSRTDASSKVPPIQRRGSLSGLSLESAVASLVAAHKASAIVKQRRPSQSNGQPPSGVPLPPPPPPNQRSLVAMRASQGKSVRIAINTDRDASATVDHAHLQGGLGQQRRSFAKTVLLHQGRSPGPGAGPGPTPKSGRNTSPTPKSGR